MNTLTFIIHGTNDKTALFAAAERFVAMLRELDMMHGFLKVDGVEHIHDLELRPETIE